MCGWVLSLGSQMQWSRSSLHLRDGRLPQVVSGGSTRVLLQLSWAGLVGGGADGGGSGFLESLPCRITLQIIRLVVLSRSCHLATGNGIPSRRKELCTTLALVRISPASGTGRFRRANCHLAAPSTGASASSWLTAGTGSLRGGGRLEQRAEVRDVRLTHASRDVPQDWRKERERDRIRLGSNHT